MSRVLVVVDAIYAPPGSLRRVVACTEPGSAAPENNPEDDQDHADDSDQPTGRAGDGRRGPIRRGGSRHGPAG